MKLTKLTKDQALKIIKASAYIGVSAAIDYLISQTSDTQFGTLTPVINILLVSIKQFFTDESRG